jgi:predicted dehydrogenase
MAELGSHQLDVTNWFSETLPIRITGSGGLYRWTEDGRDIDDHVYATCDYPAGPLAPNGLTVTFSSITSNKFDNYYEQFMGTKGTIILTGETEAMLFSEDADKATEIEVTPSAAGGPVMEASQSRLADAAGGSVAAETSELSGMGRLEPYRAELEGFCAAVKFGTKPPCAGEAALASAVVVVKANEAMDDHKVIELGPDVYAV